MNSYEREIQDKIYQLQMDDRQRQWYILRRVGAYQHQRTFLNLDINEVTINRSHSATHTFLSRFISRKHATLTNVNGAWFLKDNNSVNGTYLNTERLVPDRDYHIVENDIIGFGMPLSEQNDEHSVVYRLCKREGNRPLMPSSTRARPESSGSAMQGALNNHLLKNNNAEPIAGPSCDSSEQQRSLNQVPVAPVPMIRTNKNSQNENPVTGDSKHQNAEDIICIDLLSDDEIPPPMKQSPLCEKLSITGASIEDEIVTITSDEDNLCKETFKIKPDDDQIPIRPVNANCSTRTNLASSPAVQLTIPGMLIKQKNMEMCAEPAYAGTHCTNESFNSKECRPTDKDMNPIDRPRADDLFLASDEGANTSVELPSDSDGEMCDDIGYSQEDEVIVISDNDEYVSQKNVKMESSTVSLVKEEVLEADATGDFEENNDWDLIFRETLLKEIENDCAEEREPAPNNCEAVMEEETSPEVNLSSPHVSMPTDSNEHLAIPGPSGVIANGDARMSPDQTNDYFPVLSQEFYNGMSSSDDEEGEMSAAPETADERELEPDNTDGYNRDFQVGQRASSSAQKPTTAKAFYCSVSANNFDRLKNKSGQIPNCGVQLMTPLPNLRRRCSASTDSVQIKGLPPKSDADKQPRKAKFVPAQADKRKRKGTSAIRKQMKKDFVNKRVPIPGGGTDTVMGRRSSPKEKSSFHVKKGNDGKNSPNNKSNLTSSERQGMQEAEAGRSAAALVSALPQVGAYKERRPTIPCQVRKSRNESLVESMKDSTNKAPKRRGSPVRSDKPPVKKRPIENTAGSPVTRKESIEAPRLPKRTILLEGPAPIPAKRQPSENLIRHKLPTKPSGTANLSELGVKNTKSNKRVSFSEPLQEIRYYQPDTHKVEEHCQRNSAENALGAAPQRPEVISAIQRNLERILVWKPAWLHEQEKVKHPPPVVHPKELKNTARTYSSHAEYVKIHEPLLLLETWESISQEWRHRRDSSPVIPLVLSKIQRDHGESKSQSIFFHCNAVIEDNKEQRDSIPQEGWLVILDVPVDSENPQAKVDGIGRSYVRLFAHVESCQKSTVNYLLKDGPLHPLLKQLIWKHKDKKAVLKLILQTRCASLTVSEDRPLNLEMIAYLKPQLRIFQALHYLPYTLLGPHILKPKEELCSLSNLKSSMNLLNVGNLNYNDTQRNIILKVTETVSSPSASPKVCLIQGPPGTGKSSLIVGLVLQLLMGAHLEGNSKPRILLCTPSNGACDEILQRLLTIRKSLIDSKKPRMIRVGLLDSIQPRVKAYSLDNIVHSNIADQKTVLEKEIIALTTNLNVLQQSLDTKRLRNGKPSEINKLKMDIDRKESKLSAVRKRLNEMVNQSPEDRLRTYCNWREECLKKADVIVTTLGSCTQHGMELFLRNNKHPFICIVDEATQCIEQELLLALQFGVSKLILVGDPKQLPATVLSMKAKEKGLCRSLFERFYDYFGNSPKNPVVMLDLQYRMHPELNFYPSKAFYRNRIRTADGIEEISAHIPVDPYLFFDIRDSQEESTGVGDITNPKEAAFVVKLCEAILLILNDFPSLSLGVITFYQQQKHAIKKKLGESTIIQRLDKVKDVDVNTVDGFQGREKDFIIVSTVRANSPNSTIGFIGEQRRLNVAITRAKYSLFICGYRESLLVSDHWKSLINDATFRKRVKKVSSPIPLDALLALVTRSSR